MSAPVNYLMVRLFRFAQKIENRGHQDMAKAIYSWIKQSAEAKHQFKFVLSSVEALNDVYNKLMSLSVVTHGVRQSAEGLEFMLSNDIKITLGINAEEYDISSFVFQKILALSGEWQ